MTVQNELIKRNNFRILKTSFLSIGSMGMMAIMPDIAMSFIAPSILLAFPLGINIYNKKLIENNEKPKDFNLHNGYGKHLYQHALDYVFKKESIDEQKNEFLMHFKGFLFLSDLCFNSKSKNNFLEEERRRNIFENMLWTDIRNEISLSEYATIRFNKKMVETSLNQYPEDCKKIIQEYFHDNDQLFINILDSLNYKNQKSLSIKILKACDYSIEKILLQYESLAKEKNEKQPYNFLVDFSFIDQLIDNFPEIQNMQLDNIKNLASYVPKLNIFKENQNIIKELNLIEDERPKKPKKL